MNNNEFASADLAPLSEMTGLKYLDLSHSSNITDVSMLSGLTSLDGLCLQGIFVDLTPLAGLNNLTKLYLPEPFEGKDGMFTPDYSIF